MVEPFTVRRLIADEWQVFSAMRLRSLKDHGAVLGVGYEQEADKPEQVWRDWLDNPNKPVFGLFAGATLIGMASLYFNEKENTLYMGGSYIVPEYRGRGLSSLFSDIRIQYALEHYQSCDVLRAAHRTGNAAAIAASRKAGFLYQSQDVREWPDGTMGPQDWYGLNLKNPRMQRLSA